ncbi:MAG TPA: DUF3106 domain-containing protein [Burkholderiaceae bacterium]|nr:DUF3106 domain-containing protein [Burkholderiaceae bacterium]
MTLPGCRHLGVPSWRWLWSALLALLLAGTTAHAQPPAPVKRPAESGGPSWASLTPEQRSVLAPLQNEWPSIDATRKAKWLNLAARYPKLPADDQRRIHERMTQWAHMSPQERAQARLNYQQAKQLPKEERQDQWHAYQALPESERKALANRAQAGAKAQPAGKPMPEPSNKRNMVVNPANSSARVKPVAPTVVQAVPGATTTLVTRQPTPPAHQPAGLPKIAATPGFVDRNTLLPQRGPQGASIRLPASSPSPGKP